MKISEIIALGKLGFSKAEIQELVKAETTPAEPAPAGEEAPAPADPAPANDKTELLGAIKGLTEALQASNIKTQGMPETQAAAITVESVLNQIINSDKE